MKIPERHPVEVVHDPRAERQVNPVGGINKEIRPQSCEQDARDCDRDKKDAQNVKRLQAVLHENLVDDHLGEKRVRQGEKLHKKRGDEDLDQRPLVLFHGGKKPAQAEFFPGLLGDRREKKRLRCFGLRGDEIGLRDSVQPASRTRHDRLAAARREQDCQPLLPLNQ